MISSRLSSLAFAAFLAAGFAFASTPVTLRAATILLDDNFESYTTGSVPANPGDGNSHPWGFSGFQTNGVVAGSSPGGNSPNQKVLSLVSDGSTTSVAQRQFARQDHEFLPGASVEVSFKLKIEDLTSSSYRLRLLDSAAPALAPVTVRIAPNGAVLALTRPSTPGTGTATNITNPQGAALTTANWYEFRIVLDLYAQTYDLSITNLTNLASGSTGAIPLYQDVHSIDTLLFDPVTTSNMAVNWLLDDVRITAIPEAHTTALLFAAGLVLLGCGYRRQRQS